MIKLVVTDIDGTLVKDGYHTLNSRLNYLVYKLKEKGIIFAVASGRQYASMSHLFRDVKDEVIFIAENGAYVVCRDWEIDEHHMDKDLIAELTKDIRELDGYFLTASTKEKLYIESHDENFLDLLLNGYKNKVEVVDDILDCDLDIIKMSIYSENGIDDLAKTIVPQWKDKLGVSVAGGRWIDFMDLSVDKGVAVAKIQELMNIGIDETMAFGDNINDIGMLERASESYAVANARKEVKAVAKHVTDSNLNDGVIKVLETLV